MIIGERKYTNIMPDQVRYIVDQMLEPITNNNMLNVEQFSKWLDANPSVRTIIKESVKPQLWTLNEKGFP
jgi:hypothetical protein